MTLDLIQKGLSGLSSGFKIEEEGIMPKPRLVLRMDLA
jgi:hypothetical protein